jgi:hypothetical protein
MPHVSSYRPNSFSRCAEPPPRPPNSSRRTASCRGRSPVPLVQRAGGLRCSRRHPGVCSHSPRLLPVRSRLPHKSQFTRMSYLASASPSPRAGRGRDGDLVHEQGPGPSPDNPGRPEEGRAGPAATVRAASMPSGVLAPGRATRAGRAQGTDHRRAYRHNKPTQRHITDPSARMPSL